MTPCPMHLCNFAIMSSKLFCSLSLPLKVLLGAKVAEAGDVKYGEHCQVVYICVL